MSEQFHQLLKKYDVPAPRYTSYPAVPHWDSTPTEQQWIESMNQALDQLTPNQGAAIYMHLPFCESLCTYCGCNKRITRNRSVVAPYIEHLHKEWTLYTKALQRQDPLPLSELHLGGGTPTFFSPPEIKALLEPILSDVQIQENCEMSVEAHPGVTDTEHLQTLSKLGFNRLSLGVQDFDPKVQDIVNRKQSIEQVETLTKAARDLGYTSINFDLIYGLPLQTRKGATQTIQEVCRLRPDRIAFYSYAHVPWISPSQRRFTEADLPSPEKKREIYENGRELLEMAGYREIGMDHFALESDSLWKAYQNKELFRNFMGYIPRRVTPLIGLGVSSIGDTWNHFMQNEKRIEDYYRRLDSGELPIMRGHTLNQTDKVIRQHMLSLMTQGETKWSCPELQDQYLDSLKTRLKTEIDDKLIDLNETSCQITEKGRPFLRNICMAFDWRLAQQKDQEQKTFSQSI